MKKITVIFSIVVILMLPSCDGEDNSASFTDRDNLNKETTNEKDTERAKARSFVDKNVIFTGNSQTKATTTIIGASQTNITDSSIEIIENFFPDGTSLSNGTETITSIDSSTLDNMESSGKFIEIVDSPKIYEFNFNDNSEVATLISIDKNGEKYIILLNYISDTSGTYEKTSDQTINGVRTLTIETGIFEILESFSPVVISNNELPVTNNSLSSLFN